MSHPIGGQRRIKGSVSTDLRRRRDAPAKPPIGRQMKRAEVATASLRGDHEEADDALTDTEAPPPPVATLPFGRRALRAQPKLAVWPPVRHEYPTEEVRDADITSAGAPAGASATEVIETLAEKNRVLTRKVQELEMRLDYAKSCQLCLASTHQANECPQRVLGPPPQQPPRKAKTPPPWAVARPEAKKRPIGRSTTGEPLVPRPPPGPPPRAPSPGARRRGHDGWCQAAIEDDRQQDQSPPPRRARRPFKRPASAMRFQHHGGGRRRKP